MSATRSAALVRWVAPRASAARSLYLRPNTLAAAPESASARLTASRPTSSTIMLVASLDETTIMRSSTSRTGIGVPGAGMPSSTSSGSMLYEPAPGTCDSKVTVLVTRSSSVTSPASSARAAATSTASLTVEAA